MKKLNNYIVEKLKLTKDSKSSKPKYTCQPKDKFELREILEERLAEDKNADLNDIDVSQLTDIGYTFHRNGKAFNPLFKGLDPHNIDVSLWDVSNIKRLNCMFSGCENFDCDLSKCNVSNVETMDSMFYDCKKFKGDGLENWKVDNVKNIRCMFINCKNFNCNLENWDISNVEESGYVFEGCDSLKKLPSWYKV